MFKVVVSSRTRKALLHALCFFILFALPILFNRMHYHETFFHGKGNYLIISALEFSNAALIISSLFYLLSFSKIFYNAMLSLFFALGAASNYFLYNFSRTLTVSGVQEIFENEVSLVQEYIPPTLVLTIVASLLFFLLIRNLFLPQVIARFYLFFLFISSSLVLPYDYVTNNLFALRSTVQSYMPTNAFYSLGYFFINNHHSLKEKQSRVDITQKYHFDLADKEPLIVVMVIGESLRGDMLSLNGYSAYQNTPKLASLANLISFPHARSYTNITRESIPLMLTRAESGKVDDSLKETSIISVFKKLGFATAWIGNQGIFSDYKLTFGAIATEADYILTRSDLRTLTGSAHTYDGFMLPFLQEYIHAHKGKNMFIVIHMLGSHWKFDERYPKEFMQFKPTCVSTPGSCSKEEILNGYNNTILYTDHVLYQITSLLKDTNAFMLYASDHGFSLLENGYFSNATVHKPKEEMDIAMLIWGSENYVKTHKNQFGKIKAHQNAKVSHDNIFHTLLGCSSIRSEILNQHLNLCAID